MRNAVPREDEDDRAPDFSAVRANARLELHEAVCAERYNSLLAGQQMLAAQIATLSASVNDRFDTYSNRWHGMLLAVAGAAILGLAALVFYLLTKK